jgi:hypothetical protein
MGTIVEPCESGEVSSLAGTLGATMIMKRLCQSRGMGRIPQEL